MKTTDFEYELPAELIAQEPASERDGCRLLVMDRVSGALEDRLFRDILDYVRPNDLFIVNESRVMPSRLFGTEATSTDSVEVTLIEKLFETNSAALWKALIRTDDPPKQGAGTKLEFRNESGVLLLSATVVDDANGNGMNTIRLTSGLPSLDDAVHAIGHAPLPPYVLNSVENEELFQTVYSQRESSAVAPTAGLHFSPELIQKIRERGACWESVELEIGWGTYRTVEEDDPEDHRIHSELYTVPQRTAEAIAQAKSKGGRVIAVGTTSVRSLESAWDPDSRLVIPCQRKNTSLYLLPGSTFHVVDALITNLHEPRSTLLMLVSAFSTRDNIMNAYRHALNERYHFLSFGDAMFIQ